MRSPELTPEEEEALAALEPRVGRVLLRQRLGLERDHEAQVFRRRTHFFHLENWDSMHGLIRGSLRLVGLHERGRRNALEIEVRHHDVPIPHLPEPFDGFTLLHLSDLHVDINEAIVGALIERVRPLEYDLCVLTGDYRARTYGRFDATLAGLERLRPHLRGTPHGVLGNHDTIRLVPPMERMGYRLLLNEWVRIERGGEAIYLAGIDDAHYFRTESFHRAADDIPADAASILLSHTPETYRRASYAEFDLMLCGHTHGGQICLPGGVPVLTDADSPRALARGSWRYGRMIGYTSVGAGTSIVDVRLNCPPEITLHRLRRDLGA
jgi:predicted MPP superfamily phosphohydrolase